MNGPELFELGGWSYQTKFKKNEIPKKPVFKFYKFRLQMTEIKFEEKKSSSSGSFVICLQRKTKDKKMFF